MISVPRFSQCMHPNPFLRWTLTAANAPPATVSSPSSVSLGVPRPPTLVRWHHCAVSDHESAQSKIPGIFEDCPRREEESRRQQ